MFHHISAEGIKILGGMILGLLSASNKIGGSIAKLVTHPQTDQHRWICACCIAASTSSTYSLAWSSCFGSA